jgi:hypothetical protein
MFQRNLLSSPPTLKREALDFSETFVFIYRTTGLQNPRDSNPKITYCVKYLVIEVISRWGTQFFQTQKVTHVSSSCRSLFIVT